MIREIIVLNFRSNFLNDFELGYFCSGQNCLLIGTVLEPSDTTSESDGGTIAYFPDWQPNTKITSQDCIYGSVFIYRIIPTDTVNDVVFKNVIYSEIQSQDSSSSNPQYFLRKFYFAKNVGVIKYFEINNFNTIHIHRSYSLLRYKVVQ
jgi:hypothetical protein